MKKLIAFVLSLCIVGGSAPAALEYTAAAEIVDSGECGENMTWTLDDEGTLTISGEGDMYYWDWSVSWNPARPADVEFSGDSIPWYEFKDEITKIVVEEGVEKIGYSAFLYLYNVTSVELPGSLTEIGSYSFDHCISLREIVIPDSVTSIGYESFCDCTSLESITLPNSVTYIEKNTFNGCTSLKSIIIPDSVTSIGYSAFYSCTSLTSITIPDSVTIICYGAFDECTNLESITILNPNCQIYYHIGAPVGSYPPNSYYLSLGDCFTGTIYGYANSTAQTYAELFGYKFVVLAANGEILGNVNGDSSLDSSDAAMIIQHYAVFQSDGVGKFTEAQLAVADYNSDSSIDSSDAALILKAYAENQSK